MSARALELMAELGIYGRVRVEMLADVDRAVSVLEAAKSSGARNRAALATVLWRQGAASTPPPAEVDEPTEEPPTLSALEFAWSREASPIHSTLLAMMGYSLARRGGFERMLRDGWWWRERYDDCGELVSRTLDGAQP
jgi:hypothetical protein